MKQDLEPIMDGLKIRNKKDMFLSAEESKLLKESFTREKEGRLISAKEFRRKKRDEC